MKQQNDRVSYSFNARINLGNYQSAELHVGLESDVKPGETPETAFQRVKAFVDAEARKVYKEIKEENE